MSFLQQEGAAGATSSSLTEAIEGYLPWLAGHPLAVSLTGLALVGVVAALAYFVTRRYLLRLIARLVARSETKWDDMVLQSNFLRRAAALAPLVILHYGLDLIGLGDELRNLLQRILAAGLVITGTMALVALLSVIDDIYRSTPVSQGRPIKGYLQLVQLFFGVVGGVLAIAILLDRDPMVFVTGIGAMTAVVLLIFRDTILGFVASIQLVSNDMVRLGDWIEMPQYNADGDVIDIALHTVKVQNWDKTITTIPTHKLIEDSFRNWRAMTESGGRRIKRSISIDLSSVRFLAREDIQRFSKFVLLQDYMARKVKEHEEHNALYADEPELTPNARRLTNLGTFRAYLAEYLKQHPAIADETMTFLVRQLPPGPEGVGIEVYVFANDTRWAHYEAIQADIFDHLLAIVPQFGLRVFQRPAGADFQALARRPERSDQAAEPAR